MDRTFQTQMTGSFYNDFSLQESGLWDNREHSIYELNTFLNNFMNQLSMEDVECYRSLHEMSRHSQYQLVYYLLEDFVKEQHPETKIFESEYNDFLLTEDPVLASLAIMGGATIAGIIGNNVWKSQRGNIHKSVTKQIVGLFKYTKEKFDWIKKKSAKARAVDAMIYTNLDKCGAKCGIGTAVNQKELSRYIEYPMTKGNSVVDKQAIDQFQCLFNCYILFNISAGQGLFDAFKACSNIQMNRSMEMYINQPENISANCMDLYQAMSKHYSLYKDVIEAIPVLKPDEKQQYLVAYFKGPSAIRGFK